MWPAVAKWLLKAAQISVGFCRMFFPSIIQEGIEVVELEVMDLNAFQKRVGFEYELESRLR